MVEHKPIVPEFLTSGDEWPFEGLCEQLTIDLFSPKWEFRHGSAIGLREILKTHGLGCGRVLGQTRDANSILHKRVSSNCFDHSGSRILLVDWSAFLP